MQTISTCLWFNGNAEEAVNFYVSIIKNSRVLKTAYYLEGSHGKPGTVMMIEFVLDGVEFLALNAGSAHPFSPAMSIVVPCDTQEEIDHLWQELSAGGKEIQCGWLTDKYGVAWQIAPRIALEMFSGDDKAAAQRAFSAMLGMTKLDIAALRRAYEGR